MSETRDRTTPHVFRFSIDPAPAEVGAEAVEDVIRAEIESLLELVVFHKEGQPVAVDGYAFVNDPERVLRLRPSQRFLDLVEAGEPQTDQ